MSASKKAASLNKAQNEQKIKAQQQRQKNLVQEHKNRMLPFVRFLKKKNIRFNHARVGSSRIEYFRLDQFQAVLSQCAEQIQASPSLKTVAKQIREELVYFKRPAHLKAKYPNMLEPLLPESNEKKYASFRFDTTESKKWMMVGIIATVLSLVLFPIWPYELKYGIWLISFSLLVFLVGLIVFRLIIWLFCVIFGYDVWILPNLLGEYGFVQSFKPFIYYEKWDVSLFTVLIRVFVLSSIIAYGCYLYLNPEVLFGTFLIQTTIQRTYKAQSKQLVTSTTGESKRQKMKKTFHKGPSQIQIPFLTKLQTLQLRIYQNLKKSYKLRLMLTLHHQVKDSFDYAKK